MEEFYFKRTNEHVERVKNNALVLYKYDPIRLKLLLEQAEHHDASKFEEPELTPYIHLTHYYARKREGIEVETHPEMKEKIVDAVFHHLKNNKHHPEYYFDDAIRERRNQIVDASRMPIVSIAEMICDWKAMSQEFDNSIVDFANSVIGKKFTFSSDQVILIYEFIGALKNG